ncbi:MAG: universal stress protein [Polyangiaceae bacterium]|nr:universal stress protein [Polyangiaceae bacterium]
MAIARILVPIDFSECAAAAFDYAVGLAKALGAKITLVHVWDVPFLWPSVGDTMVTVPAEEPMTVAQLVKKRAAEELERFIAERPHAGVEVAARLAMGDPMRTICSVAQDGNHDLVVMGTHGRTGVSRVLAGSVAENVVRHCPVPVLTVRGTESAAAQPAG